MAAAANSGGIMQAISRVCVLGGGGASGLVTLKCLRACGLEATGYEMAPDIGGTWTYKDDTSDTLPIIHPGHTKEENDRGFSAMYKSLVTNLPKQVMAYSDFEFGDEVETFPGHRCVKEYLESYARHQDLEGMIRFKTRVELVARREGGGWDVTTVSVDADGAPAGDRATEPFDSVVVCNGHYSCVYAPRIKGDEGFAGVMLHSHSYREPRHDWFLDKTVVVLGGGASGTDISAELAPVCKKVYHCYYGADSAASFFHGSLEQRGGVSHFGPGPNSVTFTDGSVAHHVDIFLYATGYHYDFPFLESGLVTTDERVVWPLYKHVFHAQHPTLSFVGIPFKVIPFPCAESQAEWIARVLSGKASLPPTNEMLSDTQAAATATAERDGNTRHLHMLGASQFAYCDEIFRLAGLGKNEFMGTGTMRDVMYSERVRARALVKEAENKS